MVVVSYSPKDSGLLYHLKSRWRSPLPSSVAFFRKGLCFLPIQPMGVAIAIDPFQVVYLKWRHATAYKAAF